METGSKILAFQGPSCPWIQVTMTTPGWPQSRVFPQGELTHLGVLWVTCCWRGLPLCYGKGDRLESLSSGARTKSPGCGLEADNSF
jgi:hypothetical protein